MKKKVLITNNRLCEFTGSELDTLTIANYFYQKKYDVTIFTIDIGYPLIEKVPDDIKVLTSEQGEQLEKKYDIGWIHHFPILDYLLFDKKIEFDYIHYVSLSSYVPYEDLPIYYKDLTKVSVLSREALDTFKKSGNDVSKLSVFPNYSFEKYFKKNIVHHKKIRKICIISNHVPDELLDFANICKENEIHVDIYGKGYKFIEIDDNALKKYDVIITMAKTIYYGLSLGIPCYCYDHFGGDGYISMDNFLNSYNYNFSGRAFKYKYNGNEIYNDIISNYSSILSQSPQIRKLAYDTFCFENQMKRFEKDLNTLPKMNYIKFFKKYSWYEKKALLFLNIVTGKNMVYKLSDNYPIQYVQIYFDIGNGFNEQDSKLLYLLQKGNIYYCNFDVPDNCSQIRFDYSNKSFAFIKRLVINKRRKNLNMCNNCIKWKDGYLSINNDPNIIIPIKNKKNINVKFEMELLKSDEVIKFLTSNKK